VIDIVVLNQEISDTVKKITALRTDIDNIVKEMEA